MIESPYLDEIIREQVEKRASMRVAEKLAEELPKELSKRMHRAIASILKIRFGAIPADIASLIEKVTDDDELDSVNAWAGTCPDLASFRQKFTK
jgi:hypothetical protein